MLCVRKFVYFEKYLPLKCRLFQETETKLSVEVDIREDGLNSYLLIFLISA